MNKQIIILYSIVIAITFIIASFCLDLSSVINSAQSVDTFDVTVPTFMVLIIYLFTAIYNDLKIIFNELKQVIKIKLKRPVLPTRFIHFIQEYISCLKVSKQYKKLNVIRC